MAGLIVQLAFAPFATAADVPLATRGAHCAPAAAGAEQTRKSTVPVSPTSGSLNVATSVEEFVCAASTGVWSVG